MDKFIIIYLSYIYIIYIYIPTTGMIETTHIL